MAWLEEERVIVLKGSRQTGKTTLLLQLKQYRMNPYIQAVVHFHLKKIRDKMIEGGYEFTGKWILYGTYEMAIAVRDCIGDKTQGIFVMKGHGEGAIAYGPNLSTALNSIERVYKTFIK